MRWLAIAVIALTANERAIVYIYLPRLQTAHVLGTILRVLIVLLKVGCAYVDVQN